MIGVLFWFFWSLYFLLIQGGIPLSISGGEVLVIDQVGPIVGFPGQWLRTPHANAQDMGLNFGPGRPHMLQST